MDIIDKILSKLDREKAPSSLRARILDIPEQHAKPAFAMRFMKFAVPAIAVAALLTSAIYYQYFAVRNIAAAFELVADNSDAAGIAPDSTFVLKSSKDITAAQIKKVVKITTVDGLDSVDFSVEGSGKNRFIIKPLQKLSGNTIYQVSIAEGVAEREFAWAFQVRAPFAVLSTFPRHQATGVPINSTIEAVFNREEIQNPEKYFEITPKVPGKFEVKSDKVVFVPSRPLDQKTVYNVVFKKGLTAKGLNEALPADITFSFETNQTTYQPYSDFGFSQELVHFPTDRTPAMEVYNNNVDFSNAQASVYSFSSKEDFVKAYYASRNWDLGWTAFYRQNSQNFEAGGLTRVSQFKPELVKFEYQTFFEIPDKLNPGYYILDVKAGDIRRQAWILVNDVSHYYTLTDSNGFVWAYQYSKKSALEGANIAYYDSNGNRHDLGKTNGQGISQFNVPQDLKAGVYGSADYGKPKILEIEKPGSAASLVLVSAGWWYNGGSSNQEDYWKYLSTDRYTYKLTDTIKFWGVVKGKSQDIRQQKVKVQLREGYFNGYDYRYDLPGYSRDDKPLAETESVISPFDTVSGSLNFSGVNPGTYQVIVLMNDKVVTQTSVEILQYVKPLYQISVTPSKEAIFAGDSVDFNVKASFYDGTPVGAMKLRYNGYSNQSISGEVQLNERGEGRVTIRPEYQKNGYYPSTLSLSFYPTVAEEGDITSESSAVVTVFGPHIYLQSSQKYNDNNNFTITAKANNIVIDQNAINRDINSVYPEYIGSPASGVSLSAEVEKTEYVQIEEGTVYDPINRISVPQYRYEERKSIVNRLSGQTNSAGEWVFNLDLPKSERAYYQVRITGQDFSGRAISTTAWPYYYKDYGSRYYSGATTASNRVILSLGFEGGEKEYDKRFSVGENIKLTADALEGQQYLSGQTLFYRYGHNGIGKLEFSGTNKFQENFGKDFKPGVSYRAVVFGPYGFVESNSLLAGFKKEDAKLNIDIKPDKNSYRPGDIARVDVEVKDRNGKTGDGEVNLSVVDEAVFDVVPYYWQQDILSSLYQIDYQEPRSDASDFTPPAFEQRGGAESGGCFLPDTQILLPGDQSKAIKDVKVGDTVLTRADETNPNVLLPAIVQGTSRHLVDSYLIINKSLKVTGEHKLYVNDKWTEAGLVKVGDRLQNEQGGTVAVSSIEKVLAPNTMVYNINVGKFHTYFADGLFVHNAEKGGGYRSEFLDTAFYESKQLENGKATFSFKLPDNITSWRATASAFEPGDILAGQENKQLPASLPFFVDAVISETYLSGDKPTVTVRNFGTNFDQNADTVINVDVDSFGFHETRTVRGGLVNFELPAMQPGNFEMKIKAKQGNLEDGIVRTFSVVDSYFSTKEAKSAAITSGLTGLASNRLGYTDVTFTDEGKARFYYELLWNQYSSGKRADQVASSFLARRMLKDYFGSDIENPQLDLAAYQVPGGGMGLFTYGDSDLELTAKLSDLVPDSVYQPQIIAYFKQTMRDDKADVHRIARSLYGLASLKQPVLSKLQLVKDEKDLNVEDRMYIALAFAKLGDKEDAYAYYNQHVRPALRFEGGQAWLNGEENQTKRVKLTTLAGAVATAVGQSEDALAVWSYSREHYPSEDLDVLERFMVIRGEITRASQSEASFAYEVNGSKQDMKLENGSSRTIKFSADELKSISFSNVKGKPVAISVIETSKDPSSLQKNSDLAIKRTYWVDGREVNTFTEGQTVTVKLEYKIAKNAIDGGYQVVDYLPSGLRPITNLWQRGLSYDWQRCYQKGFPLAVEGNKVYFSAYHSRDAKDECGTYTVEYYARSAAKGEFRAAPPLIQSLKNYDSLNVGAEQRVTISPAKK